MKLFSVLSFTTKSQPCRLLTGFVLTTSVCCFSSLSLANSEAQHIKPHYLVFPPKPADKSQTQRPAKIDLIAPTPLSKVTGSTVTLKWGATQSADTYHLQVAKDPNFKWLIVDTKGLTETQSVVGSLETGKNYFWRVAGVKASNNNGYTKGYFSMSSFETN